MTEVTYERSGDTVNFIVDGHAESVADGNDPVCNACSILAQTLEQQVSEYAEIDKRSGHLAIKLDLRFLSEEERKITHSYFDLIYTGYELLESKFFSNVTILNPRVDSFL